MKRNTLLILLVVAVLAVAGGFWLYDWVLGDTQSASQPISAVPLEVATSAPGAETSPTTAPAEATQLSQPTTPAEPKQASGGATQSTAGEPVLFRIVPEESQVRFTIFEMLRGAPKDVVGVTDQVAGEIAIDLAELGNSQVGVIQVNARTLATDDDHRNQAIRNRILNTDQYEFIRFTPREIRGLQGGAEPGTSYNFQVAGDLTIRDVTRQVVFEVTVQAESLDLLKGNATAVIQRADFNLVVPDVPFVANVGKEVTIAIDFTAHAVDG
jgi:polyisoprenoid-binding protein YceI